MRERRAQLTLLTAAYAAKSSIRLSASTLRNLVK